MKPNHDKNGLPLCSEDACEDYDGKRCMRMGFQPARFCEPALAELIESTKGTYCAYCGRSYPLDDAAATAVSEHIRTCPAHPLRAAEVEITRLRGLLRACVEGHENASGLGSYELEKAIEAARKEVQG